MKQLKQKDEKKIISIDFFQDPWQTIIWCDIPKWIVFQDETQHFLLSSYLFLQFDYTISLG